QIPADLSRRCDAHEPSKEEVITSLPIRTVAMLRRRSFFLHKLFTVPRDLVQKLSAPWRPHRNCSSFSRQLELPIRFVLFSLVWAWAVSDGKNGAFNLAHFTVGAQFEKAEINRIESV